MSLTTVTHKLTPGGVVLHVREGAALHLTRLTDSEAKRLAWGLLADLEPDDEPSKPTGRKRGEAPVRMRLLQALAQGPADRHTVSRRAGCVISSSALVVTAGRGLIERIDGRGRGPILGVYRITEAGSMELRRMKADPRITGAGAPPGSL